MAYILVVQPAHRDGPYGVLMLFQAEGHQVLLRQLVTSCSPCHAGWLLVQPSLLLPKREEGSKVSRAALHYLPATAPTSWPQRLSCYSWVVHLGLDLGWGSWAQLLRCELSCAHGDTMLCLEEVLSRGCCGRKALVVVNLPFCSKQKRVTKSGL